MTQQAPAAAGPVGGRRFGVAGRAAWGVRAAPGQAGVYAPPAGDLGGGNGGLFVVGARRAVDAALRGWAQAQPGRPHEALRAAVRRANLALLAAMFDGEPDAMPVAMTALALTGREAFVAHLGHGRGYLVRGRECVQLTAEHTTRTLGVEADPRCEVIRQWVARGDTFVLCCDGPAAALARAEIAEAVRSAGPVPVAVAEELARLAARRVGDGRVAVAVVRAASGRRTARAD